MRGKSGMIILGLDPGLALPDSVQSNAINPDRRAKMRLH